MLTLTDTIRLTKKELTEHKTDRDFRIELLMAQAGFYTIKSVDRDRMVTLTWPNAEGRRAMLASRAHRLLGRTMFAGWVRAEDVPADPLAAGDYLTMLTNGITRQRFPVTDAFYCLRYLAVLLADHVFAVEVSTDTDPLELRLGFQKRPAVFLFAWAVLEEDVETALSALERGLRSGRRRKAFRSFLSFGARRRNALFPGVHRSISPCRRCLLCCGSFALRATHALLPFPEYQCAQF